MQKEKIDYPPKPFTSRVYELRKQAEKTINEMATALGLSVVTYMRIEEGADLKLTVAFRLAEIFNVSIREIWQKRQVT